LLPIAAVKPKILSAVIYESFRTKRDGRVHTENSLHLNAFEFSRGVSLFENQKKTALRFYIKQVRRYVTPLDGAYRCPQTQNVRRTCMMKNVARFGSL
jgi:hypothetical protein